MSIKSFIVACLFHIPLVNDSMDQWNILVKIGE